MTYKLCKKCKCLKPISEFGFITSTNKHNSYCKLCIAKQSKTYRTKYKNKTDTPTTIICTQCNTSKCASNFHKDKSKPSGYHYQCKDCRNSNIKTLRDSNKDYHNTRQRQWTRTPNGKKCINSQKFKNNIRTRILKALKHNYKHSSTIDLIGCPIEYLKEHLQQTAITNGYLNFDINNYSGHEYHIDHIKPCSSFNLKDPEEQKLCFHYSNLQILTAQENLIKHNSI
jgi:hypothetical protein